VSLKLSNVDLSAQVRITRTLTAAAQTLQCVYPLLRQDVAAGGQFGTCEGHIVQPLVVRLSADGY